MARPPTVFFSLFDSLYLALPEVTFRKTTCKQAFDSDFACVRAKSLQLCPVVTLWSMALKAPLSMGFSRREGWSGLPCPPPGETLLSGKAKLRCIDTRI